MSCNERAAEVEREYHARVLAEAENERMRKLAALLQERRVMRLFREPQK